MTARRKKPNLSEKYAGALLRIKIGAEGGEWLIPEPLRSSGTAKEIIAYTELDHAKLVAHGGTNKPQNLYPMAKADHREKSRTDTGRAWKGKRLEADTEAFRQRLLAKIGVAVRCKESSKPKRKWPAKKLPKKADKKAFLERAKQS